MVNIISKGVIVQSFWIPEPTLTEKNLPSQKDRVHIVTGGYAGVGKELAGILYGKDATVHIAGRNETKAQNAISFIKEQHPSSSGQLHFLLVDFSDLTTIKPAVQEFLSKESRLDVLVNNAGVMVPPKGSQTTQGHDLQFGTNMLGPFLFTKLLVPVLLDTVKIATPGSVRVVWASSSASEAMSPEGGIIFDESGVPKLLDNQHLNYGQTKFGNILFAIRFQELYGSQGIRSVSFNPGNLRTELQRYFSLAMTIISKVLLYPAIFGAYTELYSGWSEDIAADKNITYVMPWGRDGTQYIRADQRAAINDGIASKLCEWCEVETKNFS